MKAISGQLNRIIIETDYGEWYDNDTYVCLFWSDIRHTHFFWEAWQSVPLGWAKMVAGDTSAHYRNPEDAIAAARRQLAMMELIP